MKHRPLVERFRHEVTNSRRGVVLRDYSIKDPVKGAWKVHAERLIRESSATICLVGEGTWRSEPVSWEIRKSAELGKKILAVYLGSNTVRTPAALLEVGAHPVSWDVEAIIDNLQHER